MKKVLSKICLSLPAFVLIGCGGGGSSTEGTAFYVDAAVEGVTVTCGDKVSLTDTTGAFTYVEGQVCSFTIGDVVLRQTSGMTEGSVVFEDNLPVAQFLQSLDRDNNPSNGISVSAEVIEVLKNNGITELPKDEAELEAIVNILQEKGTAYFGNSVSKAEAQEHLNQTRNSFDDSQVIHGEDKENGTQQQPEGTPEKPNGTQQQPEGTPEKPNGTQQQPEGTPEKPDGTQQQPEGTPEKPNDMQQPEGTPEKPDGTQQQPNGTM